MGEHMTAEELTAMLDKAQWSQLAIAKEIGVNPRTMRRYCSGEAKIPRLVEVAVECLCGQCK